MANPNIDFTLIDIITHGFLCCTYIGRFNIYTHIIQTIRYKYCFVLNHRTKYRSFYSTIINILIYGFQGRSDCTI